MLHPYYCGAPLSITQRFDDLFNEIVKKHYSCIDWQKNQQEQSQARDDEDEETHEEETLNESKQGISTINYNIKRKCTTV